MSDVSVVLCPVDDNDNDNDNDGIDNDSNNNNNNINNNSFHLQISMALMPWPNGVASRREFENVGLLATPFGQALRALALT